MKVLVMTLQSVVIQRGLMLFCGEKTEIGSFDTPIAILAEVDCEVNLLDRFRESAFVLVLGVRFTTP